MRQPACILSFVIVLRIGLAPGVSAGELPRLRSGPMVGYGEMTEVMLWVQTTAPATVSYRFWPETDTAAAVMSTPVRTTIEEYCTARTLISGLTPGTRYTYRLLVDGSEASVPQRLMFQTQALWQWRTEPPVFTVAFGSCLFVNDSVYDRPGIPYGGEYQILEAIAAREPDLMLWLGDNTYYREVDWTSAARMNERQAHTRELPELQRLLGATHHYAIWDDHDFGPDNSDRTFNLRHDALEVFRRFWANHTYGSEESAGVFGRFVWGDVEFFLLDDRYHRSPNTLVGDSTKTMFGAAQLRWLKESLASSRAPFKIVASGNQMLVTSTFESFANYRREYQELLDWLRDQRVEGVLFLSGDRHLTELNRIDQEGFYPLYDFTCSPLTSTPTSMLPEEPRPTRVEGTLVKDKRTFGLLRFDGPRRDRTLTMECYDAGGTRLWSHAVNVRELGLPSVPDGR
jgi:alkaline phosphatase D